MPGIHWPCLAQGGAEAGGLQLRLAPWRKRNEERESKGEASGDVPIEGDDGEIFDGA